MALPSVSRKLNSIGSTSSLPASIFEKSRMSLSSVSRESAECLAMFRYSRCSSVEIGFEDQLGHADNAVHGRANFVAHGGQKFAFGEIGGVGGFAAFFELGLDFFEVGDVEESAFDDVGAQLGIGDYAYIFENPERLIVGAAQAALHVADLAERKKLREEAFAIRRIEIEAGGGKVEQFLARIVAEDRGASGVAVENFTLHGAAVDGGERTFEKQAMALFAGGELQDVGGELAIHHRGDGYDGEN